MTQFDIIPYERVGVFRFGMPESDVLSAGCIPSKKIRNRRGEQEWICDGFSIRFGAANGLLCDMGFSRKCKVALRGIEVFSDPSALEKIVKLDDNVFECYGFLVFFGLGLTLTGFHDGNESQKAVTAFTRGHWDEMRSKYTFHKWPAKPTGTGNMSGS